jgi:hypothetical protein
MRHMSTVRPRVAWALLIPAEVQCEYTGISQGSYFTDLESAIEVSARFPDLFEAATGFRQPLSYSTPVTAYEGVASLGGELVFPAEHQPMVRNQGHVLAAPEDVDRLVVPDPWKTPRFLRFVEWRRDLRRRFGDKAVGGVAGQEGPITTAGLLRGERFFLDCAMDRPRAHRLLEVVTDTFITFTRASREVEGTAPRVVGIADDYSGLIGPDMWPDLVLPYYRRIIDALGPDGCWMHTELVRREHLPLFKELPLTGLNFAEDQYLSPRDMIELGPDVPWGWHILTVSEMQQGTPDSLHRRYRELVGMGVREIRCELTVNTPVRNVRAFLEVARELE